MKFHQLIILLLTTTMMMAGCTSSATDTDHHTDLKIYTSIYPIQFATEQIGGSSIDVESVYPPGVDAHTYEPSSRDLTSMADGDAFIYLGNGMEAFAETAADALASQDIHLVESGDKKDLFMDDAHSDHHDYDPHIWLDPKRMIAMSEFIKDELINLNPEDEQLYKANFESLKQRLQDLDQSFQDTLQAKKQKKILVSHAAYGYWEERYGIEQIAISGLSSSDEPSQKELTQIIDEADAYDLDYILFEQNTPDHVAEVIQEHVDAQALSIHNLAVLTESDIDNDEDYISLMQHNLNVLDQATD